MTNAEKQWARITQLPTNANAFDLPSLNREESLYWEGYGAAVLMFVPTEKREAFVNWVSSRDDTMRIKQYIWDPSEALAHFIKGGQS